MHEPAITSVGLHVHVCQWQKSLMWPGSRIMYPGPRCGEYQYTSVAVSLQSHWEARRPGRVDCTCPAYRKIKKHVRHTIKQTELHTYHIAISLVNDQFLSFCTIIFHSFFTLLRKGSTQLGVPITYLYWEINSSPFAWSIWLFFIAWSIQLFFFRREKILIDSSFCIICLFRVSTHIYCECMCTVNRGFIPVKICSFFWTLWKIARTWNNNGPLYMYMY